MRDADDFTTSNDDERLKEIVARATQNARARHARLRLMRERNELYLASRRDELDDDQPEEEVTREL